MLRRGIPKRIIFLTLVLTVGGLLAFRPIPSTFSPNDTGRYVDDFKKQCDRPIYDTSQVKQSGSLFYFILRPICWTGESRIFLWVTLLATPFAFLFFGKWKQNAHFWPLAAFFSMTGFEFATNALRQGMGLFFLIFAIRLILDDKKTSGVLIGFISAVIHTSNIAFLPLLFWFAKFGFRKRKSAAEMVLFVAFPFLMISVLMVSSAWVLQDYFEQYQVYYKAALSPAFIAFTVLPILYTYAVRKIIASTNVSGNETATVVYSGLLLIATLVFFPAIVFRFAFTSCILQLFMTMDAGNAKMKEGLYVTGGLMLHFGLYLKFSSNPMKVLFG